ncbi:GNAT family N-acetyltransferase [Streptomyces sp. NBC_00658]|uniref:GNAT family N-acetyltransferase n=1 Tax=Streptomyces sp. NBC_00658 TaxID=2975800 RepID=UPI00324727E1
MNRHIPFAQLHNFRDLGGYQAEDGSTVRRGRLFRSDSLSKLEGADWDRFLSLGIRTVVDLRYPWEIEAKGRVPAHPSLAYHNQSIEHRPYDQSALAPDVAPGPYLAARYAEVAKDGTKEIRETLELIATAGEGPVVFHCASGKDRTGLVAALILSLLGVPERTIVEDFTLTGLATARLVADWRAANPDRELTWPGYGQAPAEVMTLFLADLNSRYGSIQSYVTQILGLDTTFISALRANLLEPAAPLTFRRATEADIPTLVRLRDEAANWQLSQGIDQWKPGQLTEPHFRTRLAEGEVWLAILNEPNAPDEQQVAGAWELWWDDPAAWGLQPPTAAYIHRLMTDRRVAPPGTGRHLLAEAERRITATGRTLARLDCLAGNPRLREYYQAAGYTVVGEQAAKDSGLGNPYAVTLLEKRLH